MMRCQVESDRYTLFRDGGIGVGWGDEAIKMDILYFRNSNSVHPDTSSWACE